MTSKEALGRIRESHVTTMLCMGITEPDVETREVIRKVEKDVDVLEEFEILRDYYPPFKEFLTKMVEDGYNGDLKHIKEWLEK